MKINEFNNQQDDFRPNFDLIDDICIFMRNDPMFYRKSYFPMINNMMEMFAKGQKINPSKTLFPVVDNAMNAYVKCYNLAKSPNDLFTKDDRMNIAKRIYSEEMNAIRQVTYNECS